jgi:hypothetical protein
MRINGNQRHTSFVYGWRDVQASPQAFDPCFQALQ